MLVSCKGNSPNVVEFLTMYLRNIKVAQNCFIFIPVSLQNDTLGFMILSSEV